MRRYRTEIVIPEDRLLTLHLPEDLPQGRAIVTIELSQVEDPDDPSSLDGFDPRHDIEWWEEFGDDDEAELEESWGLPARLGTLEF